MIDCLQIKRREENEGLGSELEKKESSEWENWWADSYNAIAKKLAVSVATTSSGSEDSSDDSSEDEGGGGRTTAIKRADMQKGKTPERAASKKSEKKETSEKEEEKESGKKKHKSKKHRKEEGEAVKESKSRKKRAIVVEEEEEEAPKRKHKKSKKSKRSADEGRHTLYELEELTVSIGRDADNDIILDSKGISRYQAVLEFHSCTSSATRKFATITDQNSVNGTFVNGIRVHPRQPHRLINGDIIVFSAFEKDTYRYEATGLIPSTLSSGDTSEGGSRPQAPHPMGPGVNGEGKSRSLVSRTYGAAGKPTVVDARGSLELHDGDERRTRKRPVPQQVSSSDLEAPVAAAAVMVHSPPRSSQNVLPFPNRASVDTPRTLQEAAAARRPRARRRPLSASPPTAAGRRRRASSISTPEWPRPPARSRSAEPSHRPRWRQSTMDSIADPSHHGSEGSGGDGDHRGRPSQSGTPGELERTIQQPGSPMQRGDYPGEPGMKTESPDRGRVRSPRHSMEDHQAGQVRYDAFVTEMESLLRLDMSGPMTMQEREARVRDDVGRIQSNLVDLLIEKSRPGVLSESVREKEEAFATVIKELTSHRERFNRLLPAPRASDASSEISRRSDVTTLSRMLYGSIDGGSSLRGAVGGDDDDDGGLPGTVAADLMKGVWALREADRAEANCKRRWTALLTELRAQQQNIKVAVDDKLSTPITEALERLRDDLTSVIEKNGDGRAVAVILEAMEAADRQHRTMQKRLIQLTAKYEAMRENLRSTQAAADEDKEALRDALIEARTGGGAMRVAELNEALGHCGERCAAVLEENSKMRAAMDDIISLVKQDKISEVVRRYLDDQKSAAAEKGRPGGDAARLDAGLVRLPRETRSCNASREEVLKSEEKLRTAEQTIRRQTEEIDTLLGRLRDEEAVNRRLMQAAAAPEGESAEEGRVSKGIVEELLEGRDARIAQLEGEVVTLRRQLADTPVHRSDVIDRPEKDAPGIEGPVSRHHSDKEAEDSDVDRAGAPPPFTLEKQLRPVIMPRQMEAALSSEPSSSRRIGDVLRFHRAEAGEETASPRPQAAPVEDDELAALSTERSEEKVGREIDRELERECRVESVPSSSVYGDDGISCLFDKRTDSDVPDDCS
ncbi:hypothetical protein FOZ60_015758 [Perkinsus olseni]|uniref:FHA domain-containing protein n=1 Tax=Perkinsus olseni TaxID=32597 RepID=A0A7J6P5P9_PEROL|nr:hypothetical protein FOZ60_015758 [Perkinsus olseni]